MTSDAVKRELDDRRREIRKLGWISAIAGTAFVLGSFFARTAPRRTSDVSISVCAVVIVVSLVILVWAVARRQSRVKTYNAMILANDPRLSGEHIPIAKD
jgi:protein-S-isoprenylcysteine O-methyltransferase Ste14